MSNEKNATPPEELERQIMSSLVPKNEREHWACGEIESLRQQLANREAQIVMLRDALNGIADPITAMRASLEEGQILDGQMAVRLSESHVYLKQKAKDALAATTDPKEPK